MRRLLATAVLLAAGCGVSDREDLVGRYRPDGAGGPDWTLARDGTCSRGAGDAACEWQWVEREGRWQVVMTFTRTRETGTDRVRYVLTPSRVPGGAVTLPVDGSTTLRKVD